MFKPYLPAFGKCQQNLVPDRQGQSASRTEPNRKSADIYPKSAIETANQTASNCFKTAHRKISEMMRAQSHLTTAPFDFGVVVDVIFK